VWPCRELSLPIKQLHIFKLYLSTRRLDITMKISWIILVTGVCATLYGSDTQQVLGSSVDLFGTAYTCENGMFLLIVLFIRRSLLYGPGVKPSIDCTDPSSESPNCSCTCTNGITFNQTLSSTFPTDTISGPSIDECQEDKTECLTQQDELRAQLDKQQQEHLLREQELKTELQRFQMFKFQYQGCYTDLDWTLLTIRASHKYMTIGICANICYGWKFFGLRANACYCDHAFQRSTQKVSDSECTDECVGDPSTKCGGRKTLSVYAHE